MPIVFVLNVFILLYWLVSGPFKGMVASPSLGCPDTPAALLSLGERNMNKLCCKELIVGQQVAVFYAIKAAASLLPVPAPSLSLPLSLTYFESTHSVGN